MDEPRAMNALELRSISVRFPTNRNWLGRVRQEVVALDDVSIDIKKGEALGLIGESGSGKSTLARVVLGLQVPDEGELLLEGSPTGVTRDLASRKARSQICQIVFQDPRASLNPRFKVWQIISEGIRIGRGASCHEQRKVAEEIADKTGITAEQLNRYPHELSGGQRQRVAIGRALATDPQLLVLDEPTSALDVTIQAQILNLLLDLQIEKELSYLFISHDVSVIEHMCNRVAVLYKGKIVESGTTENVLSKPENEYTRELISAVPRIYSEETRR